MPRADLQGTSIEYELLGASGPWLAAIPGGWHPMDDFRLFANAMVDRGHRVLLHDRRNCGRSSLDFLSEKPDDEVWADDTASLIRHLGIDRAVIVGRSAGVRVAVQTADRNPDVASGLVLWGISSGPKALRFLDNYYFSRYIRAAREGGMAAVCELDHFARLIRFRAENRTILLATPVETFIATMERRRTQFAESGRRPTPGIDDAALERIEVPTAIVRYYDSMHPASAAARVHGLIRGSELFDFAPGRAESERMTVEDEAADTPLVADLIADFITRRRVA